jgi:hypothetical protein
MRDAQAEIDRLYQLPLDQFTGARNALAAETATPAIRKLEKPGVPAWAVNQLYWQARPVYDRLVAAAERLRATHRAAVSGRSADVSAAEAAHGRALADALTNTVALLTRAGDTATPTTRQAIQETLQALPTNAVRPGRLTKPLRPAAGLEALAGIRVPAGRSPLQLVRTTTATPATAPGQRQERGRAALRKRSAAARQRADLARRRADEAATALGHVKAGLERARKKESVARRAWEEAGAEVAESERQVERAQRTAAAATAALAEALDVLARVEGG